MNIQFIEEDPKVFDEVKNIIDECLSQVNIVQTSPKDLENAKPRLEKTNLVLFDLDCETCNSLKLFEELVQNTSIPIVAIDDVRTSPNRLIKALHFGASEYLLKPFSKNLLLSTIVSHKQPSSNIPWRF
ncbi:response regulator [Dehalogenimonas formicexedens]|uniref:response regulator n=1 Tax=Dehalogenimonas formicexedens TaxID=1839801 RepID=UPI00096B89A6|nr:response regulator [Dehalogenimonas formicexedens]